MLSSRSLSNHPCWLIVPTLCGLTLCSSGENFTDPAPPTVHDVEAEPVQSPSVWDKVTFHQAPKPLPAEAVTAEWPRYLGPSDDLTTPESHLLDEFPENGPAKVWELDKGSGYTSPAIDEGRLVLFDRVDDEETIDCLDPETGERYWHVSYPVTYSDRYGFKNGPRCSAVIDSSKVYTLGVTSTLSCHDLATGTLLWQRDLDAEFPIASFFFGHGSCPLVYDGKVIVPMGTNAMEKGLSVAAFDQHTGKLVWGTEHEWNASYAAPIVRTLQGEPRLLVLGGGESDPAFGGLLCIDPENGDLFDAFPWRASKYESVNGSTPVFCGDDRVYISDAYEIGGIMLRLNSDLKWEEVYRLPDFGLHWNSPVEIEGSLYGFRGRNEPDAWFASYDVESGEENWRVDPEWEVQTPSGRDYRMRYFRGSLLHADGKTLALGELGSLGILKLNPEEFVEVDRAQLFLAQATWSPPALSRGLLYISQHERAMDGTPPRLICYDLRGE